MFEEGNVLYTKKDLIPVRIKKVLFLVDADGNETIAYQLVSDITEENWNIEKEEDLINEHLFQRRKKP